MKKILLEKPFGPFLATGLVTATIALYLKLIHPEAWFDVSVYNTDLRASQASIWFGFSLYLFLLAGIYFLTRRAKLRMKRWLIILHYTFVLLFLILFTVFSAFNYKEVQRMVSGTPITTLILVYGLVFFTDLAFFAIGILMLPVNILSAKKN
jgi:hypothetical protein